MSQIQNLYPMVEYTPNFLPHYATTDAFFWEAVQEFLSLEPTLDVTNGHRLVTGAMRSKTKPGRMQQIAEHLRREAKERTWGPITGTLAGLVAEHTGLYPDYAGFNFYRNHDDHVLFHTDSNFGFGPELDDVVVATVSLGAERDVCLRPLAEERDPVLVQALQPGSIFVMRGECQRKFLHAILPARVERGPRLSITFTVEPKAPIEDCDWVLYRNEDWEAAGLDKAKSPIVGQLPMPVFVGTVHDVFHRWKKDPAKYRAITPWFQPVRSLGDLAYHRPEFEKGAIEATIPRDPSTAVQDIPEKAFDAAGHLLEELAGLAVDVDGNESETSALLRTFVRALEGREEEVCALVKRAIRKAF